VLSGFTRRFESYERPFDGLLDILTDAFLEALEPIRNFGLYKEYERREALSTQPKGRLNLAKIAQRAFTSPYDLRIACSWYERVVDNAVNRCLLTTLELLAVKYLRLFRAKGALSRIKRINEAAGLFRGVSTESSFAFMSDIYVSDAAKLPALRSYYAEPLLLAKAIIQSQGVSLSSSGDEFSLSSLLVDMSTVFEAYLRNSLISEFSSGEVFVVDGNRREDIGGGARALFASDNRQRLGKIPMATPDMVVYKRDKDNAKVEIVIDAKYKLPDPVAEREDINQVVTYATAYGTQKALLVMPYHEGTKAGLWYVGRVGAVHVYQYNIDLAAVDGVAERKRWCAAIQALAVRPAEFIF
jgi:5-methylcytosine-specific restriction endonuclease McrBC regulatory subunit McrC